MRLHWCAAAVLLLLSAACDKDDDPAQRARRKELYPDLDTWAACAARQQAEQDRANAVTATAASAAQASRDKAAKAALDALGAKYRAMRAAQRQAALEKCFGLTTATRCTDSQRNLIVSAATDPAEQATLKQLD